MFTFHLINAIALQILNYNLLPSQLYFKILTIVSELETEVSSASESILKTGRASSTLGKFSNQSLY